MSVPFPIFVNARFRGRQVSGVERYASETLRHFMRPIRLLAPRRAHSGPAGHLWEQLALPLRAKGGVLWSPANTGPLAVAAQAVTIHDPGPLDHPEWFRPWFAAWYRWLWPRLAARVDTILTVSEFSRSRIEARLGLPPGRVRVIPAGVDSERFSPRPASEVEALRARFGLPERYLLFVGTIQPRKNLAGLIGAHRFLAEDFPGVGLVVAGGSGANFAAAKFADSDLMEGAIRFLGRVPDADLPALYSGAAVFVQPSFYEGSGLTLLEAMACGCPVAAARGSALEEYLGAAGPAFDPHDPPGIAAAVGELLEDDRKRSEARERGIARAREYPWSRCAAAVEDALAAIPLRASP